MAAGKQVAGQMEWCDSAGDFWIGDFGGKQTENRSPSKHSMSTLSELKREEKK